MEVDDESAPQVSSQPRTTVEVSADVEIEGNPEAVSSKPPATVEASGSMEIEDSAEAADVKDELIATAEAVVSTPTASSEHEDEVAVKPAAIGVMDSEAREAKMAPVQARHPAEPAVLPVPPPAVKVEVCTSVASVPVSDELKTCEEVSAPADSARAEAELEIGKPDGELLSSGTNEVEVSATEHPPPTPPPVSSASVDDAAVKSEKAKSDVVMAEPEADVKSDELSPVKQEASSSPALLFGSGRQVEDIRTSLDRIRPLVEKMIEDREAQLIAAAAAAKKSKAGRRKAGAKSKAGGKENTAAEVDAVADVKPDAEATDGEVNLFERQQEHLHRLRTKYGDGISGCAEQVITLVDYYRDFERRIDLNETWKAKVNKLSKIEASMGEYVRFVNLPVDLRDEFVQDVVKYLQLSWELTRPAN
ncbi:Metalloprotease family [Globisporangium polare]